MHENRILKTKEGRFNEEYNTLEEENTSLQKSLSRAKQTLVEFEGLKVENQSLLDEVCVFGMIYFNFNILKFMIQFEMYIKLALVISKNR